MKFSLTINGRDHALEIARGERVSFRFDGASFEAGIVEITPGVYPLVMGAEGGKSFRARVTPRTGGDPGEYSVGIDNRLYAVAVMEPRRWPRGGGAKQAPEGKQNIKASMPGKVVRILVSENQAVEAGQGLIVVEAMKMQNEMKCPKSGKVQKVLAREGQTVNAGDILLVVE